MLSLIYWKSWAKFQDEMGRKHYILDIQHLAEALYEMIAAISSLWKKAPFWSIQNISVVSNNRKVKINKTYNWTLHLLARREKNLVEKFEGFKAELQILMDNLIAYLVQCFSTLITLKCVDFNS